MLSLSTLLTALIDFRGPSAFNQYSEEDQQYDLPGAAGIRVENLKKYLEIFKGAKVVLVGEAPSFHGCRFSGIPFMSEDFLAGPSPLDWAVGAGFKRTSNGPKLMKEMSASIVWETLGRRTDVILWNAFPWYAHKQGNTSGNRLPTKDEVFKAAPVLKTFLALYPKAHVYAVGRTAEHALMEIGIEADYIRHPAMGGKRKFQEGIKRLM